MIINTFIDKRFSVNKKTDRHNTINCHTVKLEKPLL